MHKSSGRLPSLLAKVIPYIALFAVMLGLTLSLVLGRPDLAIKGLYLAIPVGLASVIAIGKPSWFREVSATFLPRVSLSSLSFRHLALLFVLLYIASLCLLIGSEARPLGYFILVGVMASLIFIQILSAAEGHTGRKGIILLQITLLSANLIFGQTLKLPLYFGYGDILGHMSFMSTILESGRVTSAMGDYQYFPLFHIFGASGTVLTGMDLQTSYFVFNGLSFLVSIPIVYLLVSQGTRDIHLPLLATLFYSQSREVIFNGMYMNTREMAFILCLLVLYLLIRGRNNLRLRAIAVLLIIPLVLMHQTTLVYFSGILVVIVLIELILNRRSSYIGYNYPVLFTTAYIGYWVWLCYPFLSRMVIMITSTTGLVAVPSPIPEQPLFVTFTSNADLTVIAFLAILGIVSLLYTNREIGAVFALLSLVAFALYFPGPASFFVPVFLTYRLPLLTSPFIAFAMAGGFLLFIRRLPIDRPHWKWITMIGVSFCVIFFLSFSSTVILGNSTDLNLGKMLPNENRLYFIESEIAAFSFYSEHSEDMPYYSDYKSLIYVRDRVNMSVEASLDVFNPDSIRNGYMLLRKQELESRGQLEFLTGVRTGFMGEIYIYRLGDSPHLQAAWAHQQKIFDNGAVLIYLK